MKLNKKKRNLIIIFSMVVILAVAGYLYVALSTRPQTIPGYSELVSHEKLVGLMDAIREEFDIPALGVIIADGENISDKALIGTREIGKDSTPTFQDHFHLGSNTKALTGFMAAKLVEDGKISWDTKFFDMFPGLKEESRKEYHEITLADLLSHRAYLPSFKTGVNEILEQIPVDLSTMDKRMEFCKIMLNEKPAKPFLSSYKYSNAGYVLAASMMEAAGGASWEELVQSIFVEDLDLDVGTGWPIDISEDQPRGHLPDSYLGEKGSGLMVFDTEYHNVNEEILNPSGELNMNMLDYARFVQMNLQGLNGKDNYLSGEIYEFIHFGLTAYSIGWENTKKGGERVSQHSGSKGNFFCHTYIAPEKDMAIIVYANSGIINALNPIESFLAGIKLDKYLKMIREIREYS